MSRRSPSRAARVLPALALSLLLALGTLALLPSAVPSARAAAVGGRAPSAATYTPVTGTISGPTQVAPTQRYTYLVNATGGPGIAPNGTLVGTLSYSASIVGANTTSGAITPPQGVLVNGSVNLTLVAPNATEPLTLYVDVTSTYNGQNSSTNLTYAITVLPPILLTAGLKVVGPTGVKAFALEIELDGAIVGSIHVPSLTSGQDYPLTFYYLGQGLSAGWHTFSVSLAEEHGLVVFQNGLESYSVSFYVPGPGPDYSLWALTGVVAFAAAVFISWTLFGPRRRGKGKS